MAATLAARIARRCARPQLSPFATGAGCVIQVGFPDFVEFLFIEPFEVKKKLVGASEGIDQFVDLDLESLCVAVATVLNQKHHQERDDRRTGVDDALSRVAKSEDRPAGGPDDDPANDDGKCIRLPCSFGHCHCHAREPTL
jgi:hypothetical protein